MRVAGFCIPANMGNSCSRSTSRAAKLSDRHLFTWLLLTAGCLAGCVKSDGNGAAAQVAARVNGHEITVRQIDELLGGEDVAPEQATAAKRRVLERLIDQELAKQQAVEKQLDRRPDTVLAMELAKNEVLARAYLEQIAAAQQKPTMADVKKYYSAHPELFAERRLYNLEELTVPEKGTSASAIRQGLRRSQDLSELADSLKILGQPATVSRTVRAAEQLPLPWLADMQRMKDGDVRVFAADGWVTAVRLLASRAVPVDEATAAPRIEQFLFNRALNEAVDAKVRQLRETSNIEYDGEFASQPREALAGSSAKPPDAGANSVKGIRARE
jgi:EpsD family peptidyl-prolyl cis-trans isomerase